MLPIEDFKQLVKNSVLVAIDLIVKNKKGEVLVGLRKNAPAKSFWFVPGGRILKNETLTNALSRISQEEIGTNLSPNDIDLVGLYDHIYEDNFFNDPEFNTHYIIIACEFTERNDKIILNNTQHDSYVFMNITDLLSSEEVHPYTKSYFLDSPKNLFITCNKSK